MSAHSCTLRAGHCSLTVTGWLRIPRDSTQFARQEMIRRPWSAYRQLTILELLGGAAVTVLVLLHRLGIDQVGNIDQHPVGIYSLTTNLFLQRVKHLVYLYRQGPRLGLAFTILGRLLPQLQ